MIVHASDIDLGSLSGQMFEELCFDLLRALGFHGLAWRAGGQDRGRDIEALLTLQNPLLGQRTERWFVECKNWAAGVDVAAISTTLDWADVERPDHLVLIVVPHLTNACKDWLERRAKTTSYRVHIVEAKAVKQLLQQCPSVCEQYFLGPAGRLFHGAHLDWIVAGVWPGIERVQYFLQNLRLDDLDDDETAFLLASFMVASDNDELGDGLAEQLARLFASAEHRVAQRRNDAFGAEVELAEEKRGAGFRQGQLVGAGKYQLLHLPCRVLYGEDVINAESLYVHCPSGRWLQIVIGRSTKRTQGYSDMFSLGSAGIPDAVVESMRRNGSSVMLLPFGGFEVEASNGDDVLVRRKVVDPPAGADNRSAT